MTPFFSRSFVFYLSLAGAFAISATPAVRATTVIPPSFDELVTQADAVFTGDVLGVRSEYAGEGSNRRIVSYATFDVLRVMKGQLATPYSLRMLGGTVGTRTLVISEAPKFVTGDRFIVFVKDNGKQFFPTVGIMYGVYRLERADTTETVTDHAGRPLESVDDIGKNGAERQARRVAVADGDNSASAAIAGMTREQFENAILSRIQTLGLH